jgi:hypothetical protein
VIGPGNVAGFGDAVPVIGTANCEKLPKLQARPGSPARERSGTRRAAVGPALRA